MTAGETANGGGGNSAEQKWSDERIAAVLSGMGKEALTMSEMGLVEKTGGNKARTAIVLTDMDKNDRNNAVNEAVQKKMNSGKLLERSAKNFALLKPVFATIYRMQANTAVRKSGNTEAAFSRLGVEASRINKESAAYAQSMARLALDEAGFQDGRNVTEVDSEDSLALTGGEKVESAGRKANREVNEALKGLYNDLYNAKKYNDTQAAEKAREAFDNELSRLQKDGLIGNEKATFGQRFLESGAMQFLAGDHSKRKVTELEGLREVAKNVELLAEHRMSTDRFSEYVDKNVSLYTAAIKEGTHTKQRVNSVLAAAGVGGLVGAITYTVIGRNARSAVKVETAKEVGKAVAGEALGRVATGVLTGAAAGGAAGATFGAIRGIQQARVKMSNAEIKDATSAERLVTAEERAKAAKAEAMKITVTDGTEGESDSNGVATGENGSARAEAGASESNNRAGDARSEAVSGENNNEAQNAKSEKAGNAREKAGMKRAIMKKVAEKAEKRRANEEERFQKINKIRDRKSAKELYDKLDRDTALLKILEAGDGQRVPLLKEMAENDPKGLAIALSELSRNEGAKGILEKHGQLKQLEALRNLESFKEVSEVIGSAVDKFMSDKGEKLSAEQLQNLKDRYQDLIENPENAGIIRENLARTIADVRARNEVSADKGIDLISFSKGNTARERYLLAQKMSEANREVMKDPEYKEKIKKNINERITELRNKNKKVRGEQAKFMAWQATISMITGGLIGAAAGGLFGYLREVSADKAETAEKAETPDTDDTEASGKGTSEVSDTSVKDTAEMENAGDANVNGASNVDTDNASDADSVSEAPEAGEIEPGATGEVETGVSDEIETRAAASSGTPGIAREAMEQREMAREAMRGATAEETGTSEGLGASGEAGAQEVEILPVDEDGRQYIEIDGQKNEIEFDDDGEMAPEDLAILEERYGEATIVSEQLEVSHGAITRETSVESFFNAENIGNNGEAGYELVDVSNKTAWLEDADGPYAGISVLQSENGAYINEGDLLLKVSSSHEEINIDNLKVVLTPNSDTRNIGIVLDVDAEGNVVVPEGSPALSMFSDGALRSGCRMQVMQEAAGGEGYEVLCTADGNMGQKLTEISYTEIGGEAPSVQTYQFENLDEAVGPSEGFRNEFLLGSRNVEPLRNSEPVEMTGSETAEGTVLKFSSTSVTMTPETIQEVNALAASGETVSYDPGAGDNAIVLNGVRAGDEVDVLTTPHRVGNYSEVLDPYFSGNKDGEMLNGPNLIRQFVDPERNLDEAEAASAFVSQIESGELSTDKILDAYLEQVGNSPEQLVEMRAMMGDFYVNLGNGPELIDTEEEVMQVAEMLKNSAAPENYTALVNDTYETLFEKLNGGEIRLVNYADEPYEYTTLGLKGADNMIMKLFARKRTSCSGYGLEFLDKDGNSVYDEEIARKLWHISSGTRLNHITERLNCCQKTADVTWPVRKVPEAVANEQVAQVTPVPQPVPGPTPTQVTTPTTSGPTPEPVTPGPTPGTNPGPTPGPTPNPTPEPEPGPTPDPVPGVIPKTDDNYQGDDANPETGTTPDLGDSGGNPIQAGEENAPLPNTDGVNTEPGGQQDWGEEPTAPPQDTNTGGAEATPGMSDEDKAREFAERTAETTSSTESTPAPEPEPQPAPTGTVLTGGGGAEEEIEEAA